MSSSSEAERHRIRLGLWPSPVSGISVALLDEGTSPTGERSVISASSGSMARAWTCQRYVGWSLEATQKWPSFAERLEQESGVRIITKSRGGCSCAAGSEALAERREKLAQLARQSGSGKYDCEMIDQSELQRLMPRMKLGANITGASFSPHDGHATLFSSSEPSTSPSKSTVETTTRECRPGTPS